MLVAPGRAPVPKAVMAAAVVEGTTVWIERISSRRHVPHVILDQLVPKPVHEDEEHLLSPGLDPEGAARLRGGAGQG